MREALFGDNGTPTRAFMCYTVIMRTRVECSCGWTRELSQFYAGKRIRCADCSAVLEVPGIGGGFYSSRDLESNLSRPTVKKGVWLPLTQGSVPHKARRSTRSCPSRNCGNSIFIIMIAVIVALNIGRILRDDDGVTRQPETTPARHQSPAEPAQAPEEAPGKPTEDVEAEDEF